VEKLNPPVSYFRRYCSVRGTSSARSVWFSERGCTANSAIEGRTTFALSKPLCVRDLHPSGRRSSPASERNTRAHDRRPLSSYSLHFPCQRRRRIAFVSKVTAIRQLVQEKQPFGRGDCGLGSSFRYHERSTVTHRVTLQTAGRRSVWGKCRSQGGISRTRLGDVGTDARCGRRSWRDNAFFFISVVNRLDLACGL
jgi:hypothetical protein